MTRSGQNLRGFRCNNTRTASVVLALGLGLAACGGLANAPWPKFQRSESNNGVATSGGVSGVIVAKSPPGLFPSGGQSFDPAIGPDGTVYVGHQEGSSGKVYALVRTDPIFTAKWGFPLDIAGPLDFPGVFISAPIIGSDGTVFIAASAGSQGRVYSLGQSSGRMNWEFDPGGPVSGSPTIGPDGTLYVPANGRLFALNSGTGQQSKPVFTAGARASSPALDSKGILYFGAGGAVTALNSATWQTVWKFPISSPDPGNPVPPGSIGVFGAPALDGKRFNDLYVWANVTAPAQPGQLFGPSFMMLYGLDIGDGHPAWHLNASIVQPPIDTGGADSSSPVFVDGASCGNINYCVFATFGVQSQQFVYAHEPFSFFQVWGPKPLPFSSVHSPVAASDGTVYISTPQGLFALDPSTGNTRWSVRDGANNPSGGAAIGPDGTVYVGGFSGFYAIH